MWPKAISMIAGGDLPIDDIVTHTFPLKDFKKGIDQVTLMKGAIHGRKRLLDGNC